MSLNREHLLQLLAAAGVGYGISRLQSQSQSQYNTTTDATNDTFEQKERTRLEKAARHAATEKGLNTEDDVRQMVRESYSARLDSDVGCCSGGIAKEVGDKLGYNSEDLVDVAEANLGVGCGNPLSFAKLQPGETVVDLGSGAGIDCLIAAKKVGPSGQVIGVDMTPDMISKSRAIVKEKAIENVSFRLGEIEYLPVADNTADAVISNCVINLSPNQIQVYRDAFRVLKPGGRLAIADVVQTSALPQHLRTAEALACWVSGAKPPDQIDADISSVGFVNITIALKPESKEVIKNWMPNSGAEDYIVSADIIAIKPLTSTIGTTIDGDDACCSSSDLADKEPKPEPVQAASWSPKKKVVKKQAW